MQHVLLAGLIKPSSLRVMKRRHFSRAILVSPPHGRMMLASSVVSDMDYVPPDTHARVRQCDACMHFRHVNEPWHVAFRAGTSLTFEYVGRRCALSS